MELSDSALVEECLAGRRDVYAQLVERHQDAVYHLAYRMTGQAADAADLAQEAFIRAFQKLDSYDANYSFRNWVMGICANRTRNFFRTVSRRRRMEEEHAQFCAVAAQEQTDDSRRAALEHALQELPEKMRLPLVLKYMEGLSYEEISRILKVGLSAVKMRILRGRDELARRMRAPEGKAGL